jgi:acyl-CoA dehydrogenase
MCKIHCTEMLSDFVDRCTQVVGVNAGSTGTGARRHSRRSTTPGNFGMQRRTVHGVMVDDTFNSGAFMDDVPVDFIKGMEGIDTIPGLKSNGQQTARQANKSSFARQ